MERNNDAGVAKTFFTLLKAFVGTGIMFLPKAFSNGGLLFSSLAMLGVSAVSMWAFHLLLECKGRYGGGYGEIGHAIAGQKMRNLILASIALSQIGFVCTGIVFVAENLLTFCEAVFGHGQKTEWWEFSTNKLIAVQMLLLIPLCWIRNISKLGPAALLADACILVGVTYIYWYDISALAKDGIHSSVVWFNPDKYTMMIGSAIFTFEGVGLILPIQSSMAQPEHFEWLLGVVMIIITIVYTSVGALCYATFGMGTQIEIINNFPQDSPLVNAVQFLYSVAVLVGTPVQLFPALRILETKIFGHKSGKKSLRTKWIKNMFRFSIVIICGVISVLGTGNLDKFVALIGSAACVPLVYVYPAYLHYKGVAETKSARIGDLVMIVVGLVGMVYTTTVTIVNSFM
ncbi:transmembrane amino acid transporter protein-domain-containing protein [Cladorrhinum sp. PSN259]|nr:transmembrane amino acid transporter protein-domain-containing protein [Cladorrhinum sp. PSN259]